VCQRLAYQSAKQSRNISRQKLTIGLDLGDRNSWYCVMDEAGQIQLEERVRTTAKTLREVFGAMPQSRIALEIGTHSPWISRLLTELGHEVIVANARKVRRGQHLLELLTGVQTVEQRHGDINDDQLRLHRGSDPHQGATVPNGSHNVVIGFQ